METRPSGRGLASRPRTMGSRPNAPKPGGGPIIWRGGCVYRINGRYYYTGAAGISPAWDAFTTTATVRQ